MRAAQLIRPIVFALLAICVIIGVLLIPRDVLSLEGIREMLHRIEALRAARPATTAAAFFAIYVLLTALSVPVGVWLTLIAGALFGFWQGLIIVSFASTLGATLACFAARYLLRDGLRAGWGDRFSQIERGLDRDGPFYLFSLRLIPVLPFFLVNLAMGLTPIRLWTFAWVSQIGMFPGTAVYVNAGTRLAALDSLSGILSIPVLLSFAALAAFPWLARAVITGIARHRRKGASGP